MGLAQARPNNMASFPGQLIVAHTKQQHAQDLRQHCTQKQHESELPIPFRTVGMHAVMSFILS